MIALTMPENRSPQADTGLAYLVGLDGEIQVQNQDGYFIKFEVHQVKATPDRPQGIKYSLSLHDPQGQRLMGFDNAHAGVKPAGSRFKHAGMHYPFDHHHRHAQDEGVAYMFETAYTLLRDFYTDVDRVLAEVAV